MFFHLIHQLYRTPVRCSQVFCTRQQTGTVLYDLDDALTFVFTIEPVQPCFSPINNWSIRAPRAGLCKTNQREKTLDRPRTHTARCPHLHTGLNDDPPSPHYSSAHYTHD